MLAKIKDKFQVTLPTELRKRGGFRVGDYVDIGINDDNNRITLAAKSVVDRAIAEGRADFEAGRYDGPFETAAEGIAHLRKQSRKRGR